MQKTKPIRDPLHNYIELTPIEQSIIELPEFQRLRFVMQNSTAYLTYPNNTHGRFLHSLGVMHIAGEMFCKSLQNSKKEDLEDYIEEATKKVEGHARRIGIKKEEIKEGWNLLLGDAARFNHRPMIGKRAGISPDHLYIINTLWQVARVAGLVHDLGHLPMSHVFEFAIGELLETLSTESPFVKDHEKRTSKFLDDVKEDAGVELAKVQETFESHEVLGVSFFNTIYPGSPGGETESEKSYRRLIRSMVQQVLLYPEPSQTSVSVQKFPGDDSGILQGLHGLVAGELDADRLDYCQRDPVQSGLELGAFDLTRIIESFVMTKEGAYFVFMPSVTAISAIEAFYHQRYLLYKYLYYHHNVVRMDGILKEILIYLIKNASDDTSANDKLRVLLRGFGLWNENVEDGDYRFIQNKRFKHIDDAWLRTMISSVYEHLHESDLEDDDKNLLLLADTFLHRKSDNIVSMWKREADYLQDIESLLEEMGHSEQQEDILIKLGEGYDGPQIKSMVKELKEELKGCQVLLIFRYLKPKIAKELKVLSGGSIVDLNTISPYSKSLNKVAGITWLLHISFVGRDMKRDLKLVEKCGEIVLKHLRIYIEAIVNGVKTPS